MPFASTLSDVSGLTPLVLGVLLFILALVFRAEMKKLIGRLTSVKAPGVSIEAEPSEAPQLLTAGESEQPPEASSAEGEEFGARAPADDDGRATAVARIETALGCSDTEALFSAMVDAAVIKDRDLMERVIERLRIVETDSHKRKLNEVRYFALLVNYAGDDSARAELERLAEDPEVRGDVKYFQGVAFYHAGHPTAAADSFAEAADAAPADNPRLRALSLGEQAKSLKAAGQTDAAASLLEAELATTPAEPGILWEALAEVYAAGGQKVLRALALQQAVATAPHDVGRRFSAAYAIGEAEETALNPSVLHHYGKVIAFEPDHPWALNNLGVTYQRIDLPIHAVESYEAARRQKNTLATANLASLLLNAGFADMAAELLNEARQEKDPHANVSSGVAELHRRRQKENQRREELTDVGQRQAEFLLRYMAARIRGADSAFTGRWRNDRGEPFELVEVEHLVTAEWSVKERKRRLSGLSHGGSARVDYSEMDYWNYSNYSGELRESGHKQKAEEWWSLADDGRSIEVMRVVGDDITMTRYNSADEKHQD